MPTARSLTDRYTPLLAMAALQVLLLALLPSRGGPDEPVGAGGRFAPGALDESGSFVGQDGGTAFSTDGSPTGVAGSPSGGVAAPGGATGPAGSGSSSSPQGSGGTTGDPALGRGRDPSEPGLWPWSNPWELQGDRGRCAKGGLVQQDVTRVQIPCVPKFTADNGGATFKGVTSTSVKVVVVLDPPDAAGTAIGASPTSFRGTFEQTRAQYVAQGEFFNKHFEFYGRKVEWIQHVRPEGTCDPTCWRNVAKEVDAKYQPFIVWYTSNSSPAFQDELSRRQIINTGNWHGPLSFNLDHQPYHYDYWMDGTLSAKVVADYWCKKMAGKPASRAGDPLLQTRTRKLGLAVPQAGAEDAKAMVGFVTGGLCGSPQTKPVVVTFDNSDIAREQEQMTTAVASMVEAGVTTAVCLSCTLIDPVFFTRAADNQNWFPEHLMSGAGGMDYDFSGRLYSPTQWANAFGPSHLAMFGTETDQDHYRAWNDVRDEGEPSPANLLGFWYQHLPAMMIQFAGPNLTPFTVERGMLGSPRLGGFASPRPWPGWQGGDPLNQAWQFGPGDYTAVQDVKEVYWDATATSNLDGQAGANVCANKCRRYEVGTFPPGEPLEES